MHCYTTNELSETVIKGKNLIYHYQKNKMPGNNPTPEAKNLHFKNSKMLMKEIREMERYTMFLDWGINIVKMTLPPKAIYRFIKSTNQITNGVSQNKKVQFVLNTKGLNSQNNLKKKSRAG